MSKLNPIVIVEDDKDDQEILQEVFEELGTGHRLQFFDDCNEVYDHLLAGGEKPFLILCDINLPRVNGIELKKRIDGTEALRKKAIPFVFFTTADEQNTVNNAYQQTNLQGYFKKGHSMDEIKENLKCILSYWSAAKHPTS